MQSPDTSTQWDPDFPRMEVLWYPANNWVLTHVHTQGAAGMEEEDDTRLGKVSSWSRGWFVFQQTNFPDIQVDISQLYLQLGMSVGLNSGPGNVKENDVRHVH